MKLITTVILLFFSCATGLNENMNSKWEILNTSGLREVNEEFKRIIFINPQDGFLFGTNYSDDVLLNKKFNEQNAVIYNSNDGGKKWNEKVVGKGYFVDATFAEHNLFALSNIPSESSYAIIDSSILYASNDTGEVWLPIFKFNNYVREIKFMNSKIGIAIAKNNKEGSLKWQILKTVDGGFKWESWFETNSIEQPIIYDDTLCFLSKKSANECYINRINLLTKNVLPEEALPQDFEPMKFIVDLNKELWIAGIQNEETMVYHRNSNGDYYVVKKFVGSSNYPAYLNILGKDIYLILGQMEKNRVEYKFYLCTKGNIWVDEVLPIATYVNPIFSCQELIWVYSGAGRIQRRNRLLSTDVYPESKDSR